ncbi:MAG: hypothetical protein QOE90_3073 [Thermoplasmata archaeon]|jgi:hypothetical protein|nr:hypothetical protein [Thermoplasmata archaeon]
MRRLVVPFALLMVASSVLAGCLAPKDAPSATTSAKSLAPTWYEAALVHDEGHNHSDITQHLNLSTPNFHLVGWNPLLTEQYKGKPAPGYGCGGWAQRADGRVLDVVNAFQNDLAFVLVDVTDSAHPQKVGEFYAKGLGSYDADITPDGKYVVLAFDQQTRTPVMGGLPAPPVLGFHGLCADNADLQFALPEDAVLAPGIVLVDVSDPAHPAFADWDPMPERNLHSVSTARIDNVTWVIGSELGGPPRPPGSPVSTSVHALGYFAFDQIMDTPLGVKLVRQSTYFTPPVSQSSEGNVSAPVRNGHTDVAMMKHPKDGKTYAYLADWEGGVLILDMSNPQTPQLVAQWVPPHPLNVNPNGDGPCYHSAVHEVLPAPTLWDGHHYLFAGQECPMKTDTKTPGGQVFVLDDTDPASLKQVGEWHLPEDTGVWTTEYQASPHYLALVNRTLFISDYHAGIWAADVSTPELLKSPPSIGVYIPAMLSPYLPEKTPTLPFDEQVDALPDGTLAINEDTTGLYVVRFDASDPAPAAPPFHYG